MTALETQALFQVEKLLNEISLYRISTAVTKELKDFEVDDHIIKNAERTADAHIDVFNKTIMEAKQWLNAVKNNPTA